MQKQSKRELLLAFKWKSLIADNIDNMWFHVNENWSKKCLVT